MQANAVIIALGSNQNGVFGSPEQALRRSIAALKAVGIEQICTSRLYETRPFGPGLQNRYFNAVLVGTSSASPPELLRQLKRIERQAGRRKTIRNGPRPLDLDLLAHGATVIGWPPPPASRPRPPLVLPHPELHRRAFVLVPLAEVAPDWVHPVLGLGARRLLSRLPFRRRDVVATLDSEWATCDKNV